MNFTVIWQVKFNFLRQGLPVIALLINYRIRKMHKANYIICQGFCELRY